MSGMLKSSGGDFWLIPTTLLSILAYGSKKMLLWIHAPTKICDPPTQSTGPRDVQEEVNHSNWSQKSAKKDTEKHWKVAPES